MTIQDIKTLINKEKERQDWNIELIASENFVSQDILDALGSCLTNKYAEGYPGARYYGGCGVVDEIEEAARTAWQTAFKTSYHVNVQPHSGSHANQCAYAAVCKPGDTILAMSMGAGAHLTHSSPVSFVSRLYNVKTYGLTADGQIDYAGIAEGLRQYNPRLLIVGASAYPRIIDFAKIRQIVNAHNDEMGAQTIYLVDMAHIAGLVAGGVHPTPFGYADIITTTTQKTLRGPRGGLIFCKPDYAKAVDKSVFPGNSGGPHMNTIAAKAICAIEASQPSFAEYAHQVVLNARAMAAEFMRLGYYLTTGGTDNHLMLIDFSRTPGMQDITGKAVQDLLDSHFITLNKNCVPDEKRKPTEASGVRIGTAAMTTKGWREDDFISCARKIDKLIRENLL